MDGLKFTSLKPDELTWDTALRLFSLRCKSANLSHRTLRVYTEKLDGFRRWITANGEPKPAEVRAEHLRAFLAYTKGRGISDQTVDGFFRVIKTLFRFLHGDGLLLLNPMEKVERPARERRFARSFTQDELVRVMKQIDSRTTLGARDYAIIALAADSGLRAEEMLTIKLGDVDWGGNSVLVLGKGRKERRVAFGQTVRKVLMHWLRLRGTIEGSDLLFVNRFGEKLSVCGMEQRLRRYTRDAGVAAPRLNLHALRHSFALAFLRNGGNAMTLQKLLGHTSLDMVRNYVNMTDDDALADHRKASPLDKMGALPGESRQVRLR